MDKITPLRERLVREFPTARLEIDLPATPQGETFIDVYMGSVHATVVESPKHGLGLYVGDDTAYGSGPDEVFGNEDDLMLRLKDLLGAQAPA